MKKSLLLIVTLMLSMVTLTSCEDLLNELWTISCAKEISGPWHQEGYEISSIGGGEYKIMEAGRPRPRYEYLSPFYFYTASIPEDAWPTSYKPFYYTFYGELSWYVYNRYGRDFLILKNGKYVYL